MKAERRALVLALGAVCVSLLFSVILYPHIETTYRARVDPDGIGKLAVNLADGNGLRYEADGTPAFDRGPVYPWIVAALFVLAGGYSVLSVQLLQGFLHGVSALLVFEIGRQIYNVRTAYVAQLLYAVHPIALWYTARIWIETTHAFFVVLAAFFLVRLFHRPGMARSILAGAILGVCSLTKSVWLLFPIVTLFVLQRRFGKDGLKYGVALIITCELVVIPWTVRNYALSGRIVPVHTSLGFNLIQGDVIGEQFPREWCCTLSFWKRGNERADSILGTGGGSFRSPENDARLIRSSVQKNLQEPLHLIRRSLSNLMTLWYLSESPAKSLVYGAIQLIFLAFAGVAVYRTKNPTSGQEILVYIMLYYISIHGMIVGWARYSMPMIPLMVIVGSSVMIKHIVERKNP